MDPVCFLRFRGMLFCVYFTSASSRTHTFRWAGQYCATFWFLDGDNVRLDSRARTLQSYRCSLASSVFHIAFRERAFLVENSTCLQLLNSSPKLSIPPRSTAG